RPCNAPQPTAFVTVTSLTPRKGDNRAKNPPDSEPIRTEGILLRMSRRFEMKGLRLAALAALFSAASAVPARADGFITPFLGFNFAGDQAANCASLTNCEDKRLDWGVAFGTTNGIFGFEGELAYSKDFFGKTPGGDNAVLTLMSNLMLVLPAGPIRPYGVV